MPVLPCLTNVMPGNDYAFSITKDGYIDYYGTLSVINQNITKEVILTENSLINELNHPSISIFPNPD
jgi:hypothetical protein